MATTIEDIKAADKSCYGNISNTQSIMLCAAGHIAEMFHMPPGKTMRCGVGDVFIRITIVASNYTDDTDANGWNISDQVYIAPGDAPATEKGFCCGNRCGGRNVMAAMYDAALDRIKAEAAAQDAA